MGEFCSSKHLGRCYEPTIFSLKLDNRDPLLFEYPSSWNGPLKDCRASRGLQAHLSYFAVSQTWLIAQSDRDNCLMLRILDLSYAGSVLQAVAKTVWTRSFFPLSNAKQDSDSSPLHFSRSYWVLNADATSDSPARCRPLLKNVRMVTRQLAFEVFLLFFYAQSFLCCCLHKWYDMPPCCTIDRLAHGKLTCAPKFTDLPGMYSMLVRNLTPP